MNLTTKKNGGNLPSLIRDFLNPSTLMGKDFLDMDWDLRSSRLGLNIPTANVSETPKEYLLELAAPGLQRKDFNIEVENNCLIISSEKEEEKKEEEEGYSRKEYSFNSFSRAFSLPENIREENIEAKYVDGVLRISIPKQKETPTKPAHKISVK